jgi:hypothetical protein
MPAAGPALLDRSARLNYAIAMSIYFAFKSRGFSLIKLVFSFNLYGVKVFIFGFSNAVFRVFRYKRNVRKIAGARLSFGLVVRGQLKKIDQSKMEHIKKYDGGLRRLEMARAIAPQGVKLFTKSAVFSNRR